MQKKAWRARKFLECPEAVEDCVLLGILGMSIEHLMLRLDYLDERGKGLWDMALSHLNPITECLRFVGGCITHAPGGVLRPFFTHFADGTDATMVRLQQKVRRMGLDIGGQVFWRFRHLGQLPLSLVQSVNPALSPERQRAYLQVPYTNEKCCNDDPCSQKIVNKYPTVAAAYNCAALRNGLRTVGISTWNGCSRNISWLLEV